MRTSFIKYLLLLLLLGGVAAAGSWYWLKYIQPFESTDNSYLKAHISLISPKETGYVQQVLFNDNQRVKPGDVLVEIDDNDYQARVAQAEAQVQTETAHIHTLETDKQTQSARIQQTEADISAAEAGLEQVNKDLQRYGNLAADGAVSIQSRDSTSAAQKQAVAQRDKVHSARLEAQSNQLALDAQIAESRARLKAAQAALELARINLANTRIVATLPGIMGNRSVQVGQLLRPGSILGYLIPDNSLFVEANFKETQIADMLPGQTVDISVDALPEHVFKGVVDSFAPAAGSEFSLLPPENATGNFTKIVRRVPIKIRFQPDDKLDQLRPGLSATVSVKVR